jgi:hypothetical protein
LARGPAPLPFCFAAALASVAAAFLAAPPPTARVAPDQLHDVVFDQASPGDDPSTSSTQRIMETADALTAEYGFQNFNRDRLKLSFQFKKTDFQAYEAQWGYTNSDLKALKTWQAKANQAALEDASAHDRSQADLDNAVAAIQAQYLQKRADYLSSRGFTLAKDNSVSVDMPLLVRKNAPLVKPLARDLDAFAQKKRYDSADVVGAAAAMVQTAMRYQVPPDTIGDLHTGGLLPPVSSLLKGWGDCDTKSGVLASILTNFPDLRMVGISVPDHYLVGVLGIPHQGQMFVEYQGLQYVLIEAAGPAWLPPGTVAETTSAMLASADGYKIQPFF